MNTSLSRVNNLFRTYWREIAVFLLFFLVAVVAVAYSTTLPFTIHGDTYVTLLANKVVVDPTYPDRQFLLNFDFKPYLYTNLLSFLVKYFSLFTYKLILLFFLVLGTCYFSYIAFRMLGFSRSISIIVALVALMPRNAITGGGFGVFIADDVLGNVFGLMFIWLLLPWFIKRKFEKKSLWPVFLVLGLCSYVHPVSLIFFSGLMFVIAFIWAVKDHDYKRDFKDLGYSIVAFCVSASLLLAKILFVTKDIGSSRSADIVASAKEYADALMFRVGWDFFPNSAVYALPFFLINFFFLLAVIYVCVCIYKKRLQKGSLMYFITEFSFIIIGLSVFLWVFIPNTEFWLVKNYDLPFLIQQSSRFFQYYYFGIFLLLAVAITLFLQNIKKRKLFLTLFLVVGIASSTFGFEIFQYVVGYYGYQREYIPMAWQSEKFTNPEETYPVICEQLKKAGVTRDDLVISSEFQLRYWCETRLYTTFEEGTIGIMRGKSELVWWFRNYKEQEQVLLQSNPDELVAFAKKIGAHYAFLDSRSDLAKAFKNSKIAITVAGDRIVVIKFK